MGELPVATQPPYAVLLYGVLSLYQAIHQSSTKNIITGSSAAQN